MTRKTALFMGLFLLLMGISATSAQSLPNWCDAPDGPWYYGDGLSRCNTQPTLADNLNMWRQGYYGALYDAGDITLDELFAIDPAIACNIIAVRLPELLISPTSSGSGSSNVADGFIGVCLDILPPVDIIEAEMFVGAPNALARFVYTDNNCQTSLDNTGAIYFVADSQADAEIICSGSATKLGVLSSTPPYPTNVYSCGT